MNVGMSHMPNWSEEKRRRVAAQLREEARKKSLGYLRDCKIAAFATCRGCRRIVPINLGRLAEAFGDERHIEVVEARLRCAKCGHKGAIIGMVWPEPGQPHLRAVA